MTKQEAIQKQIDDIMDSFEFSDVVKMMRATDWRWAGFDSGFPTGQDVRSIARQVLKESVADGAATHHGFRAWMDEGKDASGPWLRISLQWGPAWDVNDGTTYTK